MNRWIKTGLLLCLLMISPVIGQPLPTDEAGVIDYLTAKGLRISKDADGHAVALFSSGKPAMTVEEYQLIGKLTHLKQMGLNSSPLVEGQWGFLQQLPKLERLAIWHGHKFASLKPFCGLKVESLTIGGCMGLRDLNKESPERQRDAILSLRDLPNLKKINVYHSPNVPTDAHIAHLVKAFPKLDEIKTDFAAPRGMQTEITPKGLALLQKLNLKVLHVENAHSFAAEHYKSLAGIKSLEALLIDARRKAMSEEGVDVLRKLRPDVTVVVAQPGAEQPPRVPRKK